MTTREVAEKIIRESVCSHGPGAECSEYHEQDIIARIDEALRNERERCAKVADKYAADMRTVTQRTEYGEGCLQAAVYIAAAIRKGE